MTKYLLEVVYTLGDTTERRVVRFDGDKLQLPERNAEQGRDQPRHIDINLYEGLITIRL